MEFGAEFGEKFGEEFDEEFVTKNLWQRGERENTVALCHPATPCNPPTCHRRPLCRLLCRLFPRTLKSTL